jgi:hypothetical protein
MWISLKLRIRSFCCFVRDERPHQIEGLLLANTVANNEHP